MQRLLAVGENRGCLPLLQVDARCALKITVQS
jgi:hypothetical protein